MTSHRPKILLVSGDPNFITAMALNARRWATDVVCVSSFDDAEEQLHETSADVVVADLAARSVRPNAVVRMSELAESAGARLIVLASSLTRDALLCASLLGANGCISKAEPLGHVVARLQFVARYAASARHGRVTPENRPLAAAL